MNWIFLWRVLLKNRFKISTNFCSVPFYSNRINYWSNFCLLFLFGHFLLYYPSLYITLISTLDIGQGRNKFAFLLCLFWFLYCVKQFYQYIFKCFTNWVVIWEHDFFSFLSRCWAQEAADLFSIIFVYFNSGMDTQFSLWHYFLLSIILEI